MAKNPFDSNKPPLSGTIPFSLGQTERDKTYFQPLVEFARNADKKNVAADLIKSTIRDIGTIAAYTAEERAAAENIERTNGLIRSWDRENITQMFKRMHHGSASDYITRVKGIFKKAFGDIRKETMQAFFESLEDMNTLEPFATQIQKRATLIPRQAQIEFKNWYVARDALKNSNQNNESLENEEENFNSLLDELGQHFPVLRPSLNDGTTPDMESGTLFGVPIAGKLTAVNDVPQTDDVIFTGNQRDNDGSGEIRTNPRREQLVQIMHEAGFNDIAWYTVNFDREGKKTPETRNPDHNYYLLDVHQNDKSQFQLLVCDVVGHSTYIIRNPMPTDMKEPIRFSKLQSDDSVFKISYFSPEQWARQAKMFSLTPLNELDVQLKTRTYWANKKDDVIETFRAYYTDRDASYSSRDKSVIAHGPLADKTTPQRMYRALRTGAIRGLEGIGNFNRLGRLIFGDDFNPSHTARPVLSFSAPDIFRDAVLHVQAEHSLPPMNSAFARALRAGKVSGLEEVVDDPESVKSFNDLLEQAGVATKNEGGELIPAPQKSINAIARLLVHKPH